MAGPGRLTYVITAVISLYLNVFVLVVQLFLKVPAAPCAGSDAIGTAIRDCAGRGAGGLRRPGALAAIRFRPSVALAA